MAPLLAKNHSEGIVSPGNGRRCGLTKEPEERMTRQQLLDKPDFFNLVHGITLRAIQTFADNELHHREGPEDTGATDEERCVRTVSHDPRNAGQTASLTGSL